MSVLDPESGNLEAALDPRADQEAIGVPEGPIPAPPCFWCGVASVGELVIEKGRTGTHRGRAKPVMAKTAPACAHHLASVEVQS